MSKAAFVAAVAAIAPAMASEACQWFEDFGHAKCMTPMEHSVNNGIACTLVQWNDAWTEDDCTAVAYNQEGDRCEKVDDQCVSPEAVAVMTAYMMTEEGMASEKCGWNFSEEDCNGDDSCAWIEGESLAVNCLGKQTATEVAFCGHFDRESECSGAVPPKYSKLSAEERDSLFAGEGVPEDASEDSQNDSQNDDSGKSKKGQEKVQGDKKNKEKTQEGKNNGEDIQEVDAKDLPKELKDLIKAEVEKDLTKIKEESEDEASAASHLTASFLALAVTIAALSL